MNRVWLLKKRDLLSWDVKFAMGVIVLLASAKEIIARL